MTQTGTLTSLLCSLFKPVELRIWLLGREQTTELDDWLDFSGAPMVVCARVVAALEQHSKLDAGFFADLAARRPGRAAEVETEAARWRAPSPPSPPSQAVRGPVRILHLSDLHAREKTEWDARPLLTRLVDAVAELVAEGRAPDMVAITGDLAHGGLAAEYELVERWLKDDLLPVAGLGPEALLIVPGNHDVERGATGSVAVTALEDALRKGNQDVIAAVRADPDQLGPLHRRYASYLAFLGRMGVAHAASPTWSLRREIRGTSLRFAGLDTAWLASGDAMQGRLLLGLSAFHEAVPTRRDADVVVALAHHPLSWLMDWDQSAVMPPLRARVDLLLRGHLHDPDYTFVQTPHHQLVELPAGASYAGHAWPMSFQLIEIEPASNRTCAHLRTWQASYDAWVPDRTRLPPDGWTHFPLKARR